MAFLKRPVLFVIFLLAVSIAASAVHAHGLVENPPARNWFCGAVTKPDQVINNVADYPECQGAFAVDNNAGYQFMSVLTHDKGRASVRPLPDNVCGFNSETFANGPTIWDEAIDWPTSPMSSGRQDFTWNISWGPHFDDTEEFRFWITKPDFQFDVNDRLTWDDFGEEAFCAELYDDSQASANPNIVPLKESAKFTVSCSVPQRSGRHVIYAEWGRNQFTYERFHGCIDVVFDGGNTGSPVADPTPVPAPVPAPESEDEAAVAVFNISRETIAGRVSLILDGSQSLGTNLEYLWSVNAADVSGYRFIGGNQSPNTRLALGDLDNAQTVTVSLMVSNNSGQSSVSDSFLHESTTSSAWIDLGPLVNNAVTYKAGDQVAIRTVTTDGRDLFSPDPALTLTAETIAAEQWPYALSVAANSGRTDIAVGVLNENSEVIPVRDPTANRVYAVQGSSINSAFLVHTATAPEPNVNPVIDPVVEVVPTPLASCNATVRSNSNNWWAGMDISFDSNQATLDFSTTGLDLSTVNVDGSGFDITVQGSLILLTKRTWVNATTPGYLGFHGDNVPSLATVTAPHCRG